MSSESETSNPQRRVPGRGKVPQFRTIPLSPEIVALGFTDIQIQVQAHNMSIRHQDGLWLMAKYDMNDLTKTARMLETELAQYLGKPKGLPQNFDVRGFTAYLSLALMTDLQEQSAQRQEQIQMEERRVNSVLDEIRELREQNADITFERWQENLISKYNKLKDTVDKKLPKIWEALEFGLSSLRVLNIDDCTLPLIGILLGRPGSGKTVAISLLSGWVYGYYTDEWSPKAWVSHTTSVDSMDELEAIDMLPKIKDHQFLTPELATLFNLKEDDLRVALSKITRIADGHGFASDSGVYGHRAYGDTMFTWLGAVVDIPHHVYKVMSNLGPKLYFLRLPFVNITKGDLIASLTDSETFAIRYKAIEEALLDYLKWFEIGPTVLSRTPKSAHLHKVEWNPDKNESRAIWCIANLAYLLAYLRREGRAYTSEKIVVMNEDKGSEDKENEREPQYSYFTGPMEDPHRAASVLLNLAKGHALITGRNYVTMEDIPIVVKTVLSTARVERVKSFIALLDSDKDGCIDMKTLEEQLGISRATAYRYMTELNAIGLVDIEKTNDPKFTESNNPTYVKTMRLKNDEFGWFLSGDFKRLRNNFTPVDNRQFMKESDPEAEAVKNVAWNSSASKDTSEQEAKKAAENKEKLKEYEAAQARIRANLAKAKVKAKREAETKGV